MTRNMTWLILLCVGMASQVQAERVITVDGSLTEIVYALQAEDTLVAVDTTSRYPVAASALPDVGYMRQLSTEGILALQPTLVIATTDAGPERVFVQLQAAGVRVERIDNEYSVEGVLHKVERVASALGREAQGKALNGRIQQQVKQALESLPSSESSPNTLFLLGAGHQGLMASGHGTQASAMMSMLQLNNVMTYRGYKPVSTEATVQANPELVLIAYTGTQKNPELARQLVMTDAHKQQRIHELDTSLVLGFGPRIGEALQALAALAYPSIAPIQASASMQASAP